MTRDPLLNRICDELREAGAHTILLYGSRADGSANALSDYDVAGFAPVAHIVRDTRVVDGCFLDVFLYPGDALDRPTPELLKLRGSRILVQRDGTATRFLAELEAVYQQGPADSPKTRFAPATSGHGRWRFVRKEAMPKGIIGVSGC